MYPYYQPQSSVIIPIANTTQSSKIHSQITGSLKRMAMSPNSIIHSITQLQTIPPSSPTQPQISIPNQQNLTQNQISNKLITDTQTQIELNEIAKSIATWKNIKIYTDGSLEKFRHGQTAMGIGIVFLQHDQEITFSAQTSQHPSSTRAEIMAILIALILTPKSTNVTIYTDSQCAIEILKFKKSKTKRWNTSANPI